MTAGDSGLIQSFRLATVIAVAVPVAAAVFTAPLGLARTVNLAFAIAASTLAPLLLLGVWWRRLSTTGAFAGLLVGGARGASTTRPSVSLRR